MNESELAARFGHLTDKFSLGYFSSYAEILKDREAPKILEIGVEAGGSLGMWRAMCPDSLIVGVDCHPKQSSEITIVADQRDPNLPDMVREYAESYDLVVDDASHIGSFSAATVEHLWPVVAPGGWYVLEDWPVGLKNNPHYGEYEDDSMLKLAMSFVPCIRPSKNIFDMGGFGVFGGDPGDVDEVRYRYGLAMIHKNERVA